MIRASAERVTVKLLPVASFNVPCHQAVSRRLRMASAAGGGNRAGRGEREKGHLGSGFTFQCCRLKDRSEDPIV